MISFDFELLYVICTSLNNAQDTNSIPNHRTQKTSSIPKNHNNISISNPIQSQTSILPVERSRDQNIALKTNKSQKTNQTFHNIQNSVPPI